MHWRLESVETTAAYLWMRLWCSPGRHSTYRSEILEEGEASCKRKNCGWDDGKLILIFSQISWIKCIYFINALIISFKWKIWDLDSVQDASEKILTVAQERYKGWRSSFSSTYKGYSTNAERMKHKPEDVDIVEWYYLIQYFGSESFHVSLTPNSLLIPVL
jgi:hypothetical protein